MSPQAPGVTEFHSSILVTDLGHTTSSPPASVSRLFPPSTVQDSLGKGEQVPVPGGGPQVPAAGSGECAFQSERPGLGAKGAGRFWTWEWDASGLSLSYTGRAVRCHRPANGPARKMLSVGHGKPQQWERSRHAAA